MTRKKKQLTYTRLKNALIYPEVFSKFLMTFEIIYYDKRLKSSFKSVQLNFFEVLLKNVLQDIKVFF